MLVRPKSLIFLCQILRSVKRQSGTCLSFECFQDNGLIYKPNVTWKKTLLSSVQALSTYIHKGNGCKNPASLAMILGTHLSGMGKGRPDMICVRSFSKRIGAPEGIRTPDLLIRSQTLYPAELRAHFSSAWLFYHILARLSTVYSIFVIRSLQPFPKP